MDRQNKEAMVTRCALYWRSPLFWPPSAAVSRCRVEQPCHAARFLNFGRPVVQLQQHLSRDCCCPLCGRTVQPLSVRRHEASGGMKMKIALRKASHFTLDCLHLGTGAVLSEVLERRCALHRIPALRASASDQGRDTGVCGGIAAIFQANGRGRYGQGRQRGAQSWAMEGRAGAIE